MLLKSFFYPTVQVVEGERPESTPQRILTPSVESDPEILQIGALGYREM